MTTKENYETLKATIEALSIDFDKFDNKKVKAAGQRSRNHLLNAKKLCDTLRKQIINEMRELPTRHRINDESENPPKLERQDGGENKPESEQEKPIESETKPESEPETKPESEPEKPKRTRKANRVKH